MRQSLFTAMVALGVMYGSSARALDEAVIPYVEKMEAYEASHTSSTGHVTVPGGGDTYTIIGYTRHAGRTRNWACSARCQGYRFNTCTVPAGPDVWVDLGAGTGAIDSLIVSGLAYNDVFETVYLTDHGSSSEVCATDIIDSDDPRRRHPWNRLRGIKFMEISGGRGHDVLLGPYGNVFSALIGGPADDYIQSRSTDARSFAMGGQYYKASDGTITVETNAAVDGNDSISMYREAVDHLFGGAGEDCLISFDDGAPKTFNCGTGNDWFVQPANDTPPVGCERERLTCWAPYWL